MQSVIVYCGALLTCSMLAYYAQKTEKMKYFLLGALLLSLVAGVRHSSVGIDTASYLEKFHYIATGDLGWLGESLEKGLVFLCQVLLLLCRSEQFLLFMLALIGHLCVFLRFWDFRKSVSLPIAVLCYYCLFFFMSLNVIRQFCAAAVVFWGSRYLNKKRYILFSVIVLLSSFTFHKTSLLAFGYLVVEAILQRKRLQQCAEQLKIKWNDIPDEKRKKITQLLCVILGACVVVLIAVLVSNIEYFKRNYLKYLQSFRVDFGWMLMAKIVFVLGMGYHLGVFSDIQSILKGDNTATGELRIGIYCVIGWLLTSLGYFFPYLDRLGLFYYFYEIVMMAILFVESKKSKILRCLLTGGMLLLYGYTFLTGFLSDGHGCVPYLFFWQ